jgi:hypothetical protein
MPEGMRVAPYKSCVACYRGDVSTAILLEGEAEFHVAALRKLAGIPPDQAKATLLVFAEHELGCDPGKVPTGRCQGGFRLCRDCAEKTNAHIVEPGGTGGYTQPPGEEDDGGDAHDHAA